MFFQDTQVQTSKAVNINFLLLLAELWQKSNKGATPWTPKWNVLLSVMEENVLYNTSVSIVWRWLWTEKHTGNVGFF